jgi:phosphomannomutase/phosphoglucomutase
MPLKVPINLPRQNKPRSGITRNAQFVVSVRSTGLFVTDPVLRKQRAKANYFKTGRSWSRWPVLRIRALVL